MVEVELTWAIVEEMAVRGAAVLGPVFERMGGRAGRLSLQTNPANHRDPARMLEQSLRFHGLAPNMQVKFPATAAGIAAIEEATARGVSINATVSFTVPQAAWPPPRRWSAASPGARRPGTTLHDVADRDDHDRAA